MRSRSELPCILREWSRLGSAGCRLVHYVLGHLYPLWLLLYADDGDTTGIGPKKFQSLCLGFMVLEVLGFPIAYHKVTGGVNYEWVGYWMDVSRFEVGLSVRRADWVIRWLRDRAAEGSSYGTGFRQGVGRLGFAASALEYLLPFLGPIFAWAAACPVASRVRLPAMVRLLFLWMADEVEARRTVRCREVAPLQHRL